MLIEFTVANFLSIKEPATLSMVATSLVSKDKAIDTENVTQVDKDLRLLKSAAIYGANASGKTNLIEAVFFMQSFILGSSRETQAEDRIAVQRFRLSTETEKEPSFFEMVFLVGRTKYRYGFEATPKRVLTEWLFFVPNAREVKLFERTSDDIKVSDRFKEGRGIEDRTRPNALFLSVVAQFNGRMSGQLISWFSQLRINQGIDNNWDLRRATDLFHIAEDKQAILQLVKDLDLGINDIRSEQETVPRSSAPEKIKQMKGHIDEIARLAGGEISDERTHIRTAHRKYDANANALNEPVIFDLASQESAGTRRLFSLALPILEALKSGHLLIVDEMDARLHPLITCAIIGLFNSKNRNPNSAQLIFTTHDTSLLNNKIFRRDQIWFIEKDRFGASHLYSLAEFKPRNDASYEREYIEGRYGAIPFIASDLDWIVGSEHAEIS